MTAKEQETSPTVTFNVGGKIYEVSKSLLQKFPDTILAEKASSEESSPIFLDRDPDRFAYCLDFMRDNGKVHLDERVTKAALLEELKFFGFVGFMEEHIEAQQSKRSNRHAAIRIQDIIASSRKRIADRERELKELKQNIEMEQLALHCFVKSLGTASSTPCVHVNKNEFPFTGSIAVSEDHFQLYCNNFGLEYVRSVHGHGREILITIYLNKHGT